MKKHLSLLLLFTGTLLFTACGSDSAAENPEGEQTQKKESFDVRTRREIIAKLEIPATEEFTMSIHRAFINSDTIEDAIITVNRMQFAMDEAIRTGKTAKAEELGYMGNYNFFFYYDGALDAYSVPLPVPSSPGRPLDVSFAAVTSLNRKDVIIDYRIRNSGWRSYFAVLNDHDLLLVFQWKLFDKLGTEEPVAVFHELVDSPDGLSKEILIYESTLDNNEVGIKDIYGFKPSISKKGKLEYRFYYDPKFGKFAARK